MATHSINFDAKLTRITIFALITALCKQLVVKRSANMGTLKESSAENFMRGIFNDT